jgi:hypothetical protein
VQIKPANDFRGNDDEKVIITGGGGGGPPTHPCFLSIRGVAISDKSSLNGQGASYTVFNVHFLGE